MPEQATISTPARSDTPSAASDRPLRVLEVFSIRVRSGVDTHISYIAPGLRRRGVEVILAPLVESPYSDEMRAAGFHVRSPLKGFRGDPRTIFRLARIAREEKVDLIHTHAEAASFYGRFAARLAGVPSVATVHSFNPMFLKEWCPSPLLRWLVVKQDSWFSNWSEFITMGSSDIREPLLRAGFPEKKLTVIEYGLDVSKFRVDEEEARKLRHEIGISPTAPVFGYSGRLVEVKNPHLFVELAGEVLKEYPDARFLFIGDGPLRPEIDALIQSRGLTEQVRVLGWQNEPQRWLGVCDALIVSAHYETGPLAACEAMAMKRPVIATRVGVIQHVIRDRETGINADTPEELIAGTKWMLARRSEWPRMGEQIRLDLIKFLEERDPVDRLLALYKTSVEQYRQRHGGKNSHAGN